MCAPLVRVGLDRPPEVTCAAARRMGASIEADARAYDTEVEDLRRLVSGKSSVPKEQVCVCVCVWACLCGYGDPCWISCGASRGMLVHM